MHATAAISHRNGLFFMLLLMVLALRPAAAADAPPTTQPAAATAQPANPHLWKPRTTSVAVFKNGYGFFMGEGEVALRDGWCTAADVPPATFGTLAIYSHA